MAQQRGRLSLCWSTCIVTKWVSLSPLCRAINGLDKMMSQLAQRRANAEKQIADDRRAIEGLDKEISMFEGKLADVTAVRGRASR